MTSETHILRGRAASVGSGSAAQGTTGAEPADEHRGDAAHVKRDGWIDVHGHFSPPLDDDAKRAYQKYLLENDFVARLDQVSWSADAALAYLDRVGVSMQLLSNAGPHDAGSARRFNDFGATIVASHPSRFGLLSIIPMGDPGLALSEMRRCWDELNCDGFSIVSQYQGSYLGDPKFEPVWSEAERLGATIYLHPLVAGWDAPRLGRPTAFLEVCFDTARTVVDMIFAGVFRRHPQLRLVVAHAGGALPALAFRVETLGVLSWMPNPHRIRAAEIREALSGLYYDTASSSTDHALAPLLAVTDADHILYGSDYGAPCTEEAELTRNLDLLMKYERLSKPQREQMGLVAASLFPRAAERIGSDVGAAVRRSRSEHEHRV